MKSLQEIQAIRDAMHPELELRNVGSQEANPKQGRISDDSPVGKGLHGHKAGETVVINAPAGELKFRIVSVTNK